MSEGLFVVGEPALYKLWLSHEFVVLLVKQGEQHAQYKDGYRPDDYCGDNGAALLTGRLLRNCRRRRSRSQRSR